VTRVDWIACDIIMQLLVSPVLLESSVFAALKDTKVDVNRCQR